MKLMKFTASFAAVAVMACASSVNAQVELGGDLGFESGVVDPAFPGFPQELWFGFNDSNNAATTGFGPSTDNPNSGSSNAEIFINGTGNSFAGLQQLVPAVEGETYSFSFFGQDAPGTFDVGIEYRIEWRNAAGTEISRSQSTADSFGSSYAPFSVSGVAPAGTVELQAVIALQSFQGGTTGTAFIDDTSIQGPAAAIPEPGTIALFGLAACGLVARRRR